ncbi:MAG TPA: TolC family protein, partial [Steroidobacteraceae bacterium]|nr:TolC family protein [Steroidobacteraceae bacterium]
MALAGFLAACTVGPNFKTPEPPRTEGFTPPGEIPAQLGATAAPDQVQPNQTQPNQTQPNQAPAQTTAQHFVQGLDIQGQWWTLFQSPALNALIERALANSPTLQAATAALRQANETLAAERGSYLPSLSAAAGVQRQKEPGAALGLPQVPSVIYTLNSATLNVSYTLDAFGGIRRQ